MKIVDLSDLHFGHRQVSGEHMLHSLKIYAYPEIQKCNILIFSGDIFHSLLDFNSSAARAIVQFLNDIFSMSVEYTFKIRFLRGTFSHDRNQLKFIERFAHRHSLTDKIDIKVYNNISIDEETVDNESIKILYLPDNLSYKSEEEVLDTVRDLLQTRKWSTVDMIVAHGYCSHVLPYGKSGPAVTYTIENLSTICKHLAVFGHVHTPSIKTLQKFLVVYVGSMERMNHGEEEKKGFITIDTTTWKVQFIENKNTLYFLTYISSLPKGSSIEEEVEHYRQWIESSHLRIDATNYIRVKHDDVSLRQILAKISKEVYVQYNIVFSSKALSVEDTVVSVPDFTEDDNLVIPTEENIVDIIKLYIEEHNLPKLSREKIEHYWNVV